MWPSDASVVTPGVDGCSEEAERGRGENARRGLRDAGVVNTAIPPAQSASIYIGRRQKIATEQDPPKTFALAQERRVQTRHGSICGAGSKGHRRMTVRGEGAASYRGGNIEFRPLFRKQNISAPRKVSGQTEKFR